MRRAPLHRLPDGWCALTATPSRQLSIRPKGPESGGWRGRGRWASGGRPRRSASRHSEHPHDPTRHHLRRLHAAPERTRLSARTPRRGPTALYCLGAAPLLLDRAHVAPIHAPHRVPGTDMAAQVLYRYTDRYTTDIQRDTGTAATLAASVIHRYTPRARRNRPMSFLFDWHSGNAPFNPLQIHAFAPSLAPLRMASHLPIC